VSENIIITPAGGTIQFIDSADTVTTLYSDGTSLQFQAKVAGPASPASTFLTLDNSANSFRVNGVNLNVTEVKNNFGTIISKIIL
jgi:hypothetical protein